jgi:hypothetical protein
VSTPKPPPVVPTYQPPNQAQAAQGFFGGVSALQPSAQAYSSYAMPQIQQAVQGVVNNPYAAPQQAGVNAASQYATGTLAPQLQQGATSLAGLGQLGAGFAPQALSAGFDPQNALYNRTQQQVSDQSNATNAMYGLSASPYGAGVANKSLSDFNIDWQNQQLGRQATAANTAGQLTNLANAGYGGAGQLGTQAFQTGVSGATQPYSTYAGNLMNNISALGQGGTAGAAAQSPAQTFINDFATYLGIGQNAAANQNQANQARYQNQLAGQQAAWGGLGGLGSTLGSAFGLGGAFGEGGAFGGSLGGLFGGAEGAGGLMSVAPDLLAFA